MKRLFLLHSNTTVAYWQPCQTFKMELFMTIVNNEITETTSIKLFKCLYYLLTFFAKNFSSDAWNEFEYTSIFGLPLHVKLQIPIP